MKPLKQLTTKFLSYLLIGAINTALCLALMYLGARMGLGYLQYTVLGYVVAIMFSFFMNLRYTFKVEGQTFKRLTLFLLVSLTNLSLVELIEFTLIEIFLINHLIAIFFGMCWYLITGFIANSKLVYSNKLRTQSL